jgi:hypothetical protein
MTENRIFRLGNILAVLNGLPRNPSRPPMGGEVIYGNPMNHEAVSPFEKGGFKGDLTIFQRAKLLPDFLPSHQM